MDINLNLARKLRSLRFDGIIGQDVPIRTLKNILYIDHYFPVYLFAGMRGCGKTTTARAFGAAINCEKISHFRKDPKNQLVPCLECGSCVAMRAGAHPDFIEIDAASHTGVDNIRSIIEASPFMPLMGRKKIYLIDEAHMLSRAACNAFLKILEEPPSSALFILATTDRQKIIETVRSRCLQLTFRSVDSVLLHSYLTTVCQAEQISYDPSGLDVIVSESEGCVRDALNMLEQVRFGFQHVTKHAVESVLGRISDGHIVAILQAALIQKSVGAILAALHESQFEQQSAMYVWSRLITYTRACLWYHFCVPFAALGAVDFQKTQLMHTELDDVLFLLKQWYASELLFIRSQHQHAIVEMVLITSIRARVKSDGGGALPDNGTPLPSIQGPVIQEQSVTEGRENCAGEAPHNWAAAAQVSKGAVQESTSMDASWQKFLEALRMLDDPLIVSIFRQARFVERQEKTNVVCIAFGTNHQFFQELIAGAKESWQPVLDCYFGDGAVLEPLFIDDLKQRAPVKKHVQQHPGKETKDYIVHEPKNVAPVAQARYERPLTYKSTRRQAVYPQTHVVDIADANQWPNTHLVLRYFPGVIIQAK
jgi:DNA polymerase III subunit gamma/tau